MTFITAMQYLEVLRGMAREDSMAGKRARVLLDSEVTAYNIEEVKILVDAYERNR